MKDKLLKAAREVVQAYADYYQDLESGPQRIAAPMRELDEQVRWQDERAKKASDMAVMLSTFSAELAKKGERLIIKPERKE